MKTMDYLEQLRSENSGIVRKADGLGRLVIPSEIRNLLNIKPDDELMMSVAGDFIALWRTGREDRCHCCGSRNDLRRSPNGELHLCQKCLDDMKRIKEAE